MNDFRRYAKTSRAWEALPHPTLVGRQAHTLLLMANGRRSERELSLLLGEDVCPLAESLRQRGLLQELATMPIHDETDDETTAGPRLMS